MTTKERFAVYSTSIKTYLKKTFSDRHNQVRFAFATAAVIVASQFMPAITIASFWVALLLIVVTMALIVSAHPALTSVKIPYSIISYGLYLWILNALIILVLDWLLWYLETETWWWVFLYALVQAAVLCLIEVLIQEE